MELKDVYKLADKKNIAVYENRHIENKAFCVKINDLKAISMDLSKIETSRDEKFILAEEIGHLENDYLYHATDYINPLQRSNIDKAEYKAQDWASSTLVPLKELKKELKYTQDIFELAEIFNIDAKVILRAIDYYKRKELL